MDNMKEKKKKLQEIITTTNMTHNSRKAWKTIINISNDAASSTPPCLVSTNQVAHQLLTHDRGTMSIKPKQPVLPLTTEAGESMVCPFCEEEYRRGIAALNNNMAVGIDNVLLEQLINLGPKTHKNSQVAACNAQ